MKKIIALSLMTALLMVSCSEMEEITDDCGCTKTTHYRNWDKPSIESYHNSTEEVVPCQEEEVYFDEINKDFWFLVKCKFIKQ